MFLKMTRPKRKFTGWVVFIVQCKDGTYFSGFGRFLDEKLDKINQRKGYYFSTHPERFPVKVVYTEERLPFREAFAKYQYLRKMERIAKEKLITTKKWPIGGAWREFLRKFRE